MRMVSRRVLLEMRSSAVAEPDFSGKREEIQTGNMLPVSRSSKGDVVSTTMGDARMTSALVPESRIVHETAIVHPHAFIGCCNWHVLYSGARRFTRTWKLFGNHGTIGYHAVVGVKRQDMKYKEGDDCYLHIGQNNDIREYVSTHRSSKSNDCTGYR